MLPQNRGGVQPCASYAQTPCGDKCVPARHGSVRIIVMDHVSFFFFSKGWILSDNINIEEGGTTSTTTIYIIIIDTHSYIFIPNSAMSLERLSSNIGLSLPRLLPHLRRSVSSNSLSLCATRPPRSTTRCQWPFKVLPDSCSK